MKLDLKKSEFLKGFFSLFDFGFLFTIIKKNYDLLKKMIIEIRLCNLTCVFNGNVKFAKICVVKFYVSILNRLKIMIFFCKYKVNT